MFSQVDLGLEKKDQWMNAHKQTMRPCYWYEGRVCTEEEKGISTVKGGKRRDVWVYLRTIEKKIH